MAVTKTPKLVTEAELLDLMIDVARKSAEALN